MISIPFYLHSFNRPQDMEDSEDILKSFNRYAPDSDICLDLMPCLCETNTKIDYPVVLFQGERGCRTDCYQRARAVMLANPNTQFYDLGVNFSPCDTGIEYLLINSNKLPNFIRANNRTIKETVEEIVRRIISNR
jgi:hypothetical protein